MSRQKYTRKELHDALKTHAGRMKARRKIQSERISVVVYSTFRPNRFDPGTNQTRIYRGPFVYKSKYNPSIEDKKHVES